MEGTLLIPPDRGNILGRALWKSRYVVVGSPQREGNMDANQPPNNLSLSQVLSATRIKDSREKNIKIPPRMSPDSIYLSLYKSKDDWEPSQQYSMASIADCQVQMVAHRKQGPALPTLVLQIKPDPATDKLRKRRSSRTAGLTREKESGPTTLWFRPSEEGGYTLQDWARYISSLLPPSAPDAYPMSPVTPASPTFSNPFSPRRDGGQYRPGSGGQEPVRPAMQHKRSGFTRERPHTFSSESPSLRSRKSDISSHGSSLNAMGMGYVIHGNQYTTVLPTDLPSPATTVGEVPTEYTLGWTSAQGRSSTLSSPVRARGSVSSQGQAPGSQASSSPPPARESILDRAFQLRCIPGVETEVPGEYNLSSLARFDALMREAEERRKKERAQNPPITPMTSTFEEDEDADEQDTAKIEKQVKQEEVVEESEEDDEMEESSDDDVFDHDVTRDRASIGPTAQRALAFIANRHSTMAQGGRATQSYHPDNGYSILRPHTAHSRTRPAAMQRGGSQSHVPLAAAAMENQRASMRDHLSRHEKRHSTSSVKRLSFNEFTKRLSSTSSLLLSPNNGGGPGSRGSSESEATQQPITSTSRTGLRHPRGTPSQSSQSSRDSERCGWRGSVGVFGAGEGSFI